MSFQSIDKQAIAHSFGEAATSYDSAAHFQRFVGEQLLSRLPSGPCSSILDLGTGTGYFLQPLADRYSGTNIVAADLSEGMLRYVRENSVHDTPDSNVHLAVCDAENLPFRAGSFDLVFSSLALQWCYDLPRLFAGLHHILKPSGVLAYSTLLEGSLHELKISWAKVDQAQHVNDFFEKDAYVRTASNAGFQQSFQVEKKVIHYEQAVQLSRELKLLGAHNVSPGRSRGLTGKSRLKTFINEYENFRNNDGRLPATYQVGYGICIKS